MEKEKQKVYIENEILILEEKEDIIFQLPIKEIVFIGEYTNDQGPYFDDWFLFVVDNEGNTFQISMYSLNIDLVMKKLSKIFGFSRSLDLVNSSDWKSISLFPKNFYGQEFLGLVKKEPRNIIRRFLYLFGIYQYEVDYSNNLKSLIQK